MKIESKMTAEQIEGKPPAEADAVGTCNAATGVTVTHLYGVAAEMLDWISLDIFHYGVKIPLVAGVIWQGIFANPA
jgi:hypothetical protein